MSRYPGWLQIHLPVAFGTFDAPTCCRLRVVCRSPNGVVYDAAMLVTA